jgi:hypothetical protein
MPDLTFGDVAEIKIFLSQTCDDVPSWLPGGRVDAGLAVRGSRSARQQRGPRDGPAWCVVPVRSRLRRDSSLPADRDPAAGRSALTNMIIRSSRLLGGR